MNYGFSGEQKNIGRLYIYLLFYRVGITTQVLLLVKAVVKIKIIVNTSKCMFGWCDTIFYH